MQVQIFSSVKKAIEVALVKAKAANNEKSSKHLRWMLNEIGMPAELSRWCVDGPIPITRAVIIMLQLRECDTPEEEFSIIENFFKDDYWETSLSA